MTEQVEYVAKRAEMLDASRLHFMQSRTKTLNANLLILSSDPKEIKELGHDKQEIDSLYSATVKVKDLATGGGIEKLVERLEQKRRVHDMSAKVVVEIEQLEIQQRQIIGSMKENKELLDYIKDGITANTEVIKRNIEFLKLKKDRMMVKTVQLDESEERTI